MKQLLIVEDDLDMQAIYRHMLMEHAGACELVFAGGAARALLLLRQRRFDLIISDIIMGPMDGEKFLACVRKPGRNAATPVLIATVLPFDMLPAARRLKRVYFIQKPIGREELQKKVSAILGNNRRIRGSAKGGRT